MNKQADHEPTYEIDPVFLDYLDALIDEAVGETIRFDDPAEQFAFLMAARVQA